MKFSHQAVWAKLKTPTEFISGLIALSVLICAIAWLLDDMVAHVHIRVAHGWWAYQFWHARWWVLVPILMVAGGRLCARRIFGRLLWAVGAVWLLAVAFVASIALYGGLLMSLAVSFRMGGWYNSELGRNCSFNCGRRPRGKFGRSRPEAVATI